MNPLGNFNMVPNPALKNLAETIKFAKSFGSPQAFLQELQRQNPQMAQYLSQLSSTINNPVMTAYQMLAQQGLSLDQLNSLI